MANYNHDLTCYNVVESLSVYKKIYIQVSSSIHVLRKKNLEMSQNKIPK